MKFIYFIAFYSLFNQVFAQESTNGNFPPVDDQTINWNVQEKVDFYLNDNISISQINQQDRVGFQPYTRNFSYKYIWKNQEFDHYEVRDNQPGRTTSDYNSYPIHWAEYYNEGNVIHRADNGVVLFSNNLPEQKIDQVTWSLIRPEEVAPVRTVELNYSFVPDLSPLQKDELERVGYNLINNYPYSLELSSDNQYVLMDNYEKAITKVYKKNGTIEQIETEYYSLTSDKLIKFKTVTQDFYTLPAGECYMQVRTKLFQNYSVEYDDLQPRNSTLSMINKNSDPIIYPNPATNQFYIKDDPTAAISILNVTDILGHKVEYVVHRVSSDLVKVNISDILPEALFVTMMRDGKIITKKLLHIK